MLAIENGNMLALPPRLPFDFPAKLVRMLNWRTPSESRIGS
jgi:hypothetical protein